MLGLTVGRDLVVANPGSAVAQLAQAFDIFWLTSRAEGVPAVLGEAMALAIPIVATDVGSVREAVHEAKAGFVVAPRNPRAIVDASLPLVNDPELCAKLGCSGQRYARERFDVRVCADIYLLAFRKALACRARRGSASASPQTSATR